MPNDFNNLSFEINAKDNASKVLDNIAKSLEKIQKLNGTNGTNKANSLTKSFESWSKTGDLTNKVYKRAVQQGNLNVYKDAKKNVSVTTELNNRNYINTRTQKLLNDAERKRIDNQLKLELGLKKVNTETKKVTKSNSGLAKSHSGLAKLGLKLSAITVLARKLGRVFASAVKESGSYIENLNLFAVTFGRNYKQTLDWVTELSNKFGFATNELIKFTGLFKQLSTAIGITADTGDIVSQVLTQLGLDFSSFYNIDITNAMQKLQAGIFSGQTKPLRSIGIDVTYQTLDNLLKTNEALRQFGVSSKQLSQSQKAIARLIVTMQSGSNAFGDMANTINTLQNQIRVLQGSLSNLKLAIGDAIAEPVRKAIIYINAFVIALTDIIRAFVPLKKDTGLTERFNDITLGAEEVDDALENVNGSLADFDKFNVLGGQQKGFLGQDMAITKALTKELEKQKELYDKNLENVSNTKNEAIALADKIKSKLLPIIEPFLPTLGTIFNFLKEIFGFGIRAIKKIFEDLSPLKILFDDILMVMNSAYEFGIDFLKGIEFSFNDLLQGLGQAFMLLLAPTIDSFLVLFRIIETVHQSLIAFMNWDWNGFGEKISDIWNRNWFSNDLAKQFHEQGVAGFANGGITNANLIMTHENGVREWVGKQGNSTAVVNDSQMTDVMSNAVQLGVLKAFSNMDNGNSNDINRTININIGGEKIFTSIKKEANRNGYDFVRV